MKQTYMEKYENWRARVTEADLQGDLNSMDDVTISDRFSNMLEFGTGGMRGVLGAGLDRMNIYTVGRACKGFADYLTKIGADKSKGVAIAHDNRRMSKEFALHSAGVLAAAGVKTYLFTDLRPTPELSFAVRHLGCVGGIVITASHNPPEYNGYKLYDENGCQMVSPYADYVIEMVEAVADELDVACLSREQAGDLIETIGAEVDNAYYKAVEGIQLDKTSDKSGLKVVFSPQHGAACVPVTEILRGLGYNLIRVEEQCTADPEFSHTKNPNPEDPASFELAIKLAKEVSADICITTDPDGDRVGVAAYHKGEWVYFTGNQTGALLIDYVLSRRAALNKIGDKGVMINTVVTSEIGDAIARKYDVAVVKTLTGFKFIGDKIHEYELSGQYDFQFGYEESYGYMIESFVRDKDSVQAAVMVCEMANALKLEGKTLVDALEAIYKEHDYHIESQLAITLKGKEGQEKIAQIMKSYRSNPPKEIAGIAVKAYEDYLTSKRVEDGVEEALTLPVSDVLKYVLEDGSWAAIRPSGTEPKCKFYFGVKAKEKSDAEALHAKIRAVFDVKY